MAPRRERDRLASGAGASGPRQGTGTFGSSSGFQHWLGMGGGAQSHLCLCFPPGGAGAQPGGECGPGSGRSSALGELGEHQDQGELRPRRGRGDEGQRSAGETRVHPFHPADLWADQRGPQCPRGAHTWPGVPDVPPPAQGSCQAIKEYVDSTLGPFILNVTSGARLCSEALCSGHGRCARRPDHPEALLLLNPSSFSIELPPGGGPLTLRGALSPEDRKRMAVEFQCHCYPGWRGAGCEQRGRW